MLERDFLNSKLLDVEFVFLSFTISEEVLLYANLVILKMKNFRLHSSDREKDCSFQKYWIWKDEQASSKFVFRTPINQISFQH